MSDWSIQVVLPWFLSAIILLVADFGIVCLLKKRLRSGSPACVANYIGISKIIMILVVVCTVLLFHPPLVRFGKVVAYVFLVVAMLVPPVIKEALGADRTIEAVWTAVLIALSFLVGVLGECCAFLSDEQARSCISAAQLSLSAAALSNALSIVLVFLSKKRR